MRLIEIKEKVRGSNMSKKIFQEIWAQEVDTVSGDSPDAKQKLADEMQRAKENKNMYRVPLSRESKQYLMDQAVPNMIDIAKDNQDNRLVRSLQQFQARMHAKLVGIRN
jgi:transcription initiation factor IIF auxiliary subunit